MDAPQVSGWQNRMLGRYRLLRLLGQGGMGEVWLAEDIQLRRKVAVKLLPTVYTSDRSYLQDFEREARSAAALEHPHILPIHDFGEQRMAEDEVVTYLITPYISGGSLLDRIRRANGPFPPEEVLGYLRQAAEAIDYAHSHNVLHRDIKPSNMLLQPMPAHLASVTGSAQADQPDEAVWLFLADFGIAKLLTSNTLRSRTYAGSGTPAYMAPEQVHGKAEPASDRYSFAMTAYQLCTGSVAFKGNTPYDILIQQMSKEPPPPRQLNPALPPAVEEAILQGLAKQPGARPPTCTALVESLERGWKVQVTEAPKEITEPPTTILPLPEPPHLPPSELPQRKISRRTLITGGATAALVVVGGSAALYELLRSNPISYHPVSPTRYSPGPGKLVSGVPVLSLTGHTKSVNIARWDPTGRYLLTGADDSSAMLWDITSAAKQSTNGVQPVSTPQWRWKLPSEVLPNKLCWSGDGRTIAIATGDNGSPGNNKIYLFGAFSNSDTPRIYQDKSAANSASQLTYYAIAWSPTANAFVTPSYVPQQTQQLVDLWQVNQTNRPVRMLASDATGKVRTLIDDYVHLANINVNVNMVSWSPDGKALAAHTNFGTVTIWQAATGTITQVLSLPARPIAWSPISVSGEYLAWSPTNPLLLAVSNIDIITLWDIQQNRQVGTLETGIVLTAAQLAQLKSLNTYVSVSGLAWSPNGKYLAASFQAAPHIRIWDMQEAGRTSPLKPLLSFPNSGSPGHTAPIQDIAWSPDGHYIASASEDATVLVWKVDASFKGRKNL